ncbi:MAG: hypothetical protein ACXIUV_01455 [Alkalilacustris sp.]
MLPVSSGVFAGLPAQSARPAAEPPNAPAPAPLSAPTAIAKVEWAGAVRPPDALLRAFRPDLLPKADADVPTGPPPAFAANMLDLLPESMIPAEEPEPAATEAAVPDASDDDVPNRALVAEGDVAEGDGTDAFA